MAKKTTPTDAPATMPAVAQEPAVTPAAASAIEPEAYYRVAATGRFRAFGIGFGPSSETHVTGAILTRLLASEFAGKVSGWAAV